MRGLSLVDITGIRLENIRGFEGEHFVPIASGLTVLMGRNNAGKSTVLRAPFLVMPPSRDNMRFAEYCRSGTTTSETTLRINVPPADFERCLGFSLERIRDVQVQNRSSAWTPLADHNDFVGWPARPVVELGARMSANRPPVKILRVVSTQPDIRSFLAVDLHSKARARLAGIDVLTNAEPAWFQRAFSALENESEALSTCLVAHWEHHRPDAVSGWIKQPKRRLVDTDEKQLQETLTFLRLKHPADFDRISTALARAFPEFQRLDFIDVEKEKFNYRPAFVARGGSNQPLARENIGSGAWTFLCILTAARVAKVTGARLLMLDEPHLYLHPGLERRLIDDLLNLEEWDDEPLQVVAATHSPTFVNAAVERGTLNILDWKDVERTSVTIRAGLTAALFDKLTSQPSDLLYADRLVFVEGPSDVVALKMLARERCNLQQPLRFVPLRESDAITSEVARYFSVVVQSHGLGFQTMGLLVLDCDKKNQLEAKWDKLDQGLDPRRVAGLDIAWAGAPGNDVESAFCDEDFLVAYFVHHGVPDAKCRQTVRTTLAKVKMPATSKAEKGCAAIRSLHEELLLTAGGTKAEDLEKLMRFYMDKADEPFAERPRTLLKPLEDALRKLGIT
jgi:predicted ATPase